MKLILASQSPRRKELLESVGLAFETKNAYVDEAQITEDVLRGTRVEETDELFDDVFSKLVFELAYAKAEAVFESLEGEDRSDVVVIGCDTIVVSEGEIFGKPKDDEDAKRMLVALSGKTHQVYTTAVLISEGSFTYVPGITDVTFFELDDFQTHHIDVYVKSGSPRDKAGAYGIQDYGALFVEKIEGDYYNVMGLPLANLVRTLSDFSKTESVH